MTLQKNVLHFLKPGVLFFYVGLLGYIIFFLFRPSIDLSSSASIQLSSDKAIETKLTLNERLNLSSENLESAAFRFQDINLFKELRNINTNFGATPHRMNRNRVPLNYWRVTSGYLYEDYAAITSDNQIFNDVGLSQMVLSNQGEIINFRINPARNTSLYPSELSYDSLLNIITEVFGYQLDNYIYDDSPAIESPEDGPIFFSENRPNDSGSVTLTKVRPSIPGPETLVLDYSFIDSDEEKGFRINSFNANFIEDRSTLQAANDELIFLIFFLGIFSLITIVVIITAVRQIFAQRVEWKRAIIIFVFVTLLLFFRRYDLFANTFYTFIDSTIFLTDLFVGLLLSMFYGVYAALAYIAWESLARKQSMGQISLIDSVWSGKIFHKQVSKGVIAGYAIAGISLGIFGFVLFSANNVYALSSFAEVGFSEVSTTIPSVSLLINAIINSILFVLPQVALVYCVFATFIDKDAIRIPLTIIISGITLTALSQFVEVSGGHTFTIIMYTLVSIPIVLAYRYLGLMSAIFAWFTLVIILRIIPFIGSPDAIISLHGWLAITFLLTPLVFSLVGIRYGDTIKIGKGYLPDYEARRFKQLRSEKELAVAKESQFALLPSKAPEVKKLDVYGFFVPSYEVGGDFYDYCVIRNGQNEPKSLALTIVDVSGKAMKAAFNAVFSSGLISSRIQTDNPDTILTQINPIIKEKTDRQTFITCQIGKIDLESLTLEIANAGHCLPLIKRNGKVKALSMPDPRYPLGVLSKVDYQYLTFQLKSGDVLMMYSDGFPEALSPKNERLGFDTTEKILADLDTNNMNSREICDHIKQLLLNYSNYELADDTTLICVKVL